MIGKDLGNIRKLPWFVDEAYMNKINIDENFKDNQESIYIDNFITITPYTFADVTVPVAAAAATAFTPAAASSTTI